MVLPWPAPLSRPPTLQRFWKQGDSLYPRRGLRPLHPAWGTEGFVLACQRARGRGWAGFPRLQPHSLIVCDSLIVCAPAFSSPVGVEPLQRRYKALQAVTRALQSRYEPLRVVTSRYTVVTEPLLILRAVTELGGFKEPVPDNGILSGPGLPRRVLPLGLFPQRPCHRGILCG